MHSLLSLPQVLQHPQLSLLPSLNTVVSKATLNVNTALFAGAGSGHEPTFHGFVGQGGLTASVAGQVFASPSTGQVLATLKLLAKSYKEILIVVNNYTGDRLNFGLAVEEAKLEGIKSKLFCFGDDVAFQNNPKTGKRGLAGVTFLVKCLGALSQRALSLDQLYNEAVNLTSKIATMSVSLSSCDVPGSGTSFVLGADELELGLGIHGESGVSRTKKLLSSKEAVKLMVDSLLDINKSPLRITRNSNDVAVLINNTGGLSNFEMNVVIKDTIEELTSRGLNVKRLLSGTICSSFSMIGVSISLMQVNDEILQLLDWPCDTPILNGCQKFKAINFDQFTDDSNVTSTVLDAPYLEMPGVASDKWTKMLKASASAIIQVEDLLNQLDKVGGDGDCGLTCRKGAESLLEILKSNGKPSLLSLVSISNSMGGTSGAIYSLFLTSLHSSLVQLHQVKSSDDVGKMSLIEIVTFWSNALADALKVITQYSWAQEGDRTMLDTLHSMQRTLCGVTPDQSVEEVILAVLSAAVIGSESTSTMPCRAGRASYANIGSIVNSPDPGAVGVTVWVKAMASSLGYSSK